MVAEQVRSALGGGNASVDAEDATRSSAGAYDCVGTDAVAVERLLDAGVVSEVVKWIDSLLGRSEKRLSLFSPVQETRRQVAAKLKRLDTLKRAVENLETRLRRQQEGLALELTPGLSDRYLGRQQQREGERQSFPLSYAQQQMLALQQMHPDSSTYNITRAVRVTAELPLDIEALRAAVQALLAKHETLRTLFELDPIGGEPQQIVLPITAVSASTDNNQGCDCPLVDAVVRVLDWIEPTAEFTDDDAIGEFIAAQVALAPFNLAREIPVRIVAIRVPTSRVVAETQTCAVRSGWILVVVLHHIVTDGASSVIVWRDLFEAYACLLPAGSDRCDSTSKIESLIPQGAAVRYRDYAVWQRERVQSGALDASIAYWCRQFDSDEKYDDVGTHAFKPLPILELPFDKKSERTVEAAGDFPKGDVVKFRASNAAIARMTTLCQSQGCSLFMGLLAVFFELLSRLSGGATDITIGTPVSARDREELQQVMGYFVNTLPLRIRAGSCNRHAVTGASTPTSGDQGTFTDLLQSVRDVVLGAFAHMEVPFHEILERVRASSRRRRQIQRQSDDITSEYDEGDIDESRPHPLYQVMFALEQHGGSAVDELNDCEFGPELLLPHATAKFDLMLTMRVVNQRRNGETSTTLEGEMEFPLDKFSHESVERFTRYYCELLEQVTQQPDESFRHISMLPHDDQQFIVKTWGASPPIATSSKLDDREIGAFASPFIDECLRRQVRLTPTNWALHFDNGESWSYATLWRESCRVFHALTGIPISQGADDANSDESGSQLRVGLFLARGLVNAAAIVGAMRARAVFIPLDASFPRERLRYMIRDAALHAIVTQRSHEDKLSELLSDEAFEGCSRMERSDAGCAHARVLMWEDLPLAGDGDDEQMDIHEQQNRTHSLEEDGAAYILYTSGSTGAPKGVVISHGNLLTTLRWTIRAYDVSSDDVFLQSTSATLDGSLTQLLSPLLAGGAAVITRDGGLHDLDYMCSLLSAPQPRAVTYCVLVPSYLSTLLDYHNHSEDTGTFCFPPTLKHVVIVGEAFPMELARKFYRLLLHSRRRHSQADLSTTTCLVNEYGPTEAAVTSTFFRLPLSSVLPNDENDPSSTNQGTDTDTVPIGVPIDGRRAVVLDARGRLVPPNVCGELFLGGPGVSVGGYWRRPDLTKNAFHHPELSEMLRPLAEGGEMRWYRTGDVVKWIPDGNLVFVGRVDAQVKLHGQRVELNEVRNVLLRHEGVVDAEVRVVTTNASADRNKRRQGSGLRLVAFVILTSHRTGRHDRRQLGGSDGAVGKLVTFLRERLPLHMVPQEIRAVARWPRTPNGKLDVRALLSDASLSADRRVASEPSTGSMSSSSTAPPRTSTDRELDSSDDELIDSSLAQRVTRDLLLQIWRQVLDLDGITDDHASWHTQSFFSLGGDSLAAIRAISLARARGIALTLDAFFTCANVDEMASRASTTTHMASLTSQPLVPLNVASSRHSQKDGAPLTLFLIHCADGTVWKLLELASLLPFRVVGIQATGSNGADTVETLAEKYWAEIQTMQPRGPYALGGFSFGCRVAHEIARIASHAGHRLRPLTLLDGVPFYEDDQNGQDVDVEAYITETFGGHKPHKEETELFDRLAAQFRAHCAMEDAYRPLRSCSISNNSPSSTALELAAVVYKTDKWDVDTAAIRAGGVVVHSVTFPGVTHLSLLRRPHVAQVAAEICKRLEG